MFSFLIKIQANLITLIFKVSYQREVPYQLEHKSITNDPITKIEMKMECLSNE